VEDQETYRFPSLNGLIDLGCLDFSFFLRLCYFTSAVLLVLWDFYLFFSSSLQ
jgi:hypothetical protein